MLKAQELRLKAMMDQMNKSNELQVKFQFDLFNHQVKDLRAIAKECHILFVQAVKRV